MTDGQGAQDGIGEITVRNQRLVQIKETMDHSRARQLASEYKTKAMGMFSQLIFRPKAEEISIAFEEKQYRAFWHIIGSATVEYRRKVRHRVAVEPSVKLVEVEGRQYPVSSDSHSFSIELIEHCRDDLKQELLVDAQTGTPGNFEKFINCPIFEIPNTNVLATEGAIVANIEVKAPFLIRRIIGDLMKPLKADEVLHEQLTIETLDLCFYPVYLFEFHWSVKDKKVTIEFDAITGEIRKGQRITDRLIKNFTGDDIFEFAKEIADFVPGGGLAMMAGRKAYHIARKK